MSLFAESWPNRGGSAFLGYRAFRERAEASQ
jgi:hypothetical protein